jgi:hypothetical protein
VEIFNIVQFNHTIAEFRSVYSPVIVPFTGVWDSGLPRDGEKRAVVSDLKLLIMLV